MTYVEFIEDANGDAVDVVTFCWMHAPNRNNAWPCWDADATCKVCGSVLRDLSGKGRS